jgi:coiled-coil-helix-coiled-coil-helix domain-containing protein 2
MFGGGSSYAPAEQQAQQTQVDTAVAQPSAYEQTGACQTDAKNFRSCMDQNRGDLTICGWYLDQLKACQQAASPY